MTNEAMKNIEMGMQLINMKAGEPITERQLKAVEHFLGPLLEAFRKVEMKRTTIKFANGKPYIEGKDEFGISVDGKRLPEVFEGGKNEPT